MKRVKGSLFLIGTPIGNLEDISFRALRVLKSCDYIYAEDTRKARVLFNHYQITTATRSFNAQTEKRRIRAIETLLEQGKDIGLISDAGMTGIQDPGAELTTYLRSAGYTVTVIPGASSVSAVMSLSGINLKNLRFYGFLPANKAKKNRVLNELFAWPYGSLLFVACHDLCALLEQMQALRMRELMLFKELTKLYERVLSGSAASLSAQIKDIDPKPHGEFVLLIVPIEKQLTEAQASCEVQKSRALELVFELQKHLPQSTSCSIAASHYRIKRSNLYQSLIEQQNQSASDL